MMFVNIYAGELPIRKTSNIDLNNVLKGMGCGMHLFCLKKNQISHDQCHRNLIIFCM